MSVRPKIAILVTCADWRLHARGVDLNARIAERLGVDGVDEFSVAGPDGLLLPARRTEWKSLLEQVERLITAHNPVVLGVAGHQDCAGHRVSDARHAADVVATAEALKQATGFSGPIHGILLVRRSDRAWDLQSLAQF
jgi:hypothetical protein